MQIAEMSEQDSAEAEAAGAPGMVPGRRLGRSLQALDRGTQRRRATPARRPWRRRRRSGAASRAQWRGPVRPGRRPAATVACSSARSPRYWGPTSNRPASPQTAVGVAARRGHQIGQQRRPHDVEVGADRIEQTQNPAVTPNSRAVSEAHEGIGHRFRRGRARPARAWPSRTRRWRSSIAGFGSGVIAWQRHRRDVVEAFDPQHLLDEVRFALDIEAPGRHRDPQPAVILGRRRSRAAPGYRPSLRSSRRDRPAPRSATAGR